MPGPRKKFFSPAEANATLPLVRRIVGDITDLARDLRESHARFVRLSQRSGTPDEDLHRMELELEQGQERMQELLNELHDLGVLLKDFFSGLVDFPHWRDGREVYLCWKLGEPDVAHWHEIDAGFSGRQRLMTEVR